MTERNRPPTEAGANPASVGGDIGKGRTGDKVHGFDPAVAPMETDAEAGGTSSPPPDEWPHPALSHIKSNPNASSHGTAMREFEHERTANQFGMLLLVLVLVVAVAFAGWILLEILDA